MSKDNDRKTSYERTSKVKSEEQPQNSRGNLIENLFTQLYSLFAERGTREGDRELNTNETEQNHHERQQMQIDNLATESDRSWDEYLENNRSKKIMEDITRIDDEVTRKQKQVMREDYLEEKKLEADKIKAQDEVDRDLNETQKRNMRYAYIKEHHEHDWPDVIYDLENELNLLEGRSKRTINMTREEFRNVGHEIFLDNWVESIDDRVRLIRYFREEERASQKTQNMKRKRSVSTVDSASSSSLGSATDEYSSTHSEENQEHNPERARGGGRMAASSHLDIVERPRERSAEGGASDNFHTTRLAKSRKREKGHNRSNSI